MSDSKAAYSAFLGWAREGRIVLDKSRRVCLVMRRMRGRRIYESPIPLNAAMTSIYLELVEDNLLHPPSLDRPAMVVEDMFTGVAVSDMSDKQYRLYCARNGFPWCDICERPAIWREGFGYRHTTPQHPNGVPRDEDRSGHKVTVKGWFNDNF